MIKRLSIAVVPGSGTGALLAITGTFRLDIVDGRHLYEFEYTLPQYVKPNRRIKRLPRTP